MAQDPELAELARRYLDLWEEQMSEFIQNPDTTGHWARYWAQFMNNLGQFGSQHGGTAQSTTGWPAAWTGAAATAFDPSLDDLERLADRVGALEKRITELESSRVAKPKSGGTSKGAASKTARAGKKPTAKRPRTKPTTR